MEPTPGAPVAVQLTDMAFGGDAIGRIDGEVVFVPFGLPGERVTVRVERRKRDFATGALAAVLEPSAARIEPRCAYFGTCGGCQWQQCAYPTQLAMKRQVLVDQLRRIGGFAAPDELVAPPIGMLEPWGYRNHVRFSLGRKFGDVGYTYRQSHRLLPIEHCLIAHPAIDRVLGMIQRRCAGLAAHQIAVRYGSNTGDLLVQPRLPMVPELDASATELTEEVLDRRYHISAAAFFQVNTRREAREIPEHLAAAWSPRRRDYSITDLLALTVLDRLGPQPEDLVIDAYCGVGTFTALIAPHVREVVGIEESPAAVQDALRNTADLANVRFVTGKVEQVLPTMSDLRLDAVVIDPARVGCAPAVVQALVAARPSRLVYVSCDPATLARDLRALVDGGYTLQRIEPFDMFPQTYHIESVATLLWNRPR